MLLQALCSNGVSISCLHVEISRPNTVINWNTCQHQPNVIHIWHLFCLESKYIDRNKNIINLV